MKKNVLKIIYFSISWLIVGITLGMSFQYLKILFKGVDYHWTDSLAIQIGGTLTGIAASTVFFILDYFFMSKLSGKIKITICRLIVLALLVLFFMIEPLQEFLK